MIADHLLVRAAGIRPRLGGVRVIAIDGPAGSGKTTLGDALAERGAAVLHLDDLYDGWSGLEPLDVVSRDL